MFFVPFRCVTKAPMVRLMLGALAAQGCAVELDRHIICEMCTRGQSGRI